MNSRRLDILLISIIPAICLGAPGTPGAPKAPEAPEARAPVAEALPGLDELLGLDEGDSADDDQHGRELDRMLTAREAAESLAQAVQLMDDTAVRLARPDGTDLITQRLQEDILRKLDKIIESAEQNRGKGGGSSSGASARQQAQQSRPASQSTGAQQSSGHGDNTGQTGAPQGQDPVLGPRTLMDAAAWGALPDRLRDALRQGVSESFSSAYRRLTESYYRRLAEQAQEQE